MNIYLNVPYSEKEDAKLLGARWNAVVRRWYFTEKQDALLFEKWFDKATSVIEEKENKSITLREYVAEMYGGHHAALTHKAARVFGVPYPLESGWLKKYGNRVANPERLVFQRKQKKPKPKKATKPMKPMNTKLKEKKPAITGPSVFVPLCECDALPWDDCEHTERMAHNSMMEMLT
jgi:hypothetical protein